MSNYLFVHQTHEGKLSGHAYQSFFALKKGTIPIFEKLSIQS